MKNLYLLVAILLINLVTYGQGVPVDYYDGISGTGYTLKTNLCNLIDGHSQQTYDALWTHFQTTDVDSHYENDGSVLDMYSENPDGADPYNFTYTSDQCGTYGIEGDCYNREHSFPKSWFDDGYPMYSDLFHLYPTDGKVNGYRGNYPFGETSSPTTTSDNGCKLGPSSYSGYTGTVFEPIDEFKGDFARSYFYMATRYEDVISGWSGSDMLDGSSDKVFTTWALNMLIEWHLGDPVSQKEIDRNDAVYDIQGNANPFIDNPSYVTAIWTTDPTLMVSSTSLSGYSYEVGSGPSTSQNFNLSGINLDGSQVTVSAPTNYEVSTDNSSFSASVNVNYSAPTLSSTMIYVRLKAGLSIASYNGENVTCNDNGTASDVIVSNSGSVTATSLFCDDFEDNLNDWIVTNDADPDAFIEIINTFGGANSSTNAALFTTPNPGATTYYTSSIEKTFLNSQNLSVNFWYFFEDYRGGEINIYINGTKFYGIATEGGGDIAISDTDDDIWTEILLDLSGSTSTLDDYTIKIEGISKSASTWQDRVAIDELCVYGTTVSGPSLSVSTSSLTGYTYVEGAGPSTSQTFTISGSDLDGTEVTVTAPTNYEVSLDDATFAATRTISYTAPTLNATTVYVRLKAGLSVGTFNGETISIAGGGDSDGASVTCSGEVTAVPDPEPDNQPADFAATANGSSQIDLGWTDASAGQIPAGYLILANEAGTFTAPSDGTDPAEDTDLSDGSAVVKVAHGSGASHSFTGLSASTQYYFTIYSYTNSASDINFKTDAPPTANATTDATPSSCGSEDFVNAGNIGSYGTINWTGLNLVDWTATDARSDVDLDGNETVMLRNGTLSNDAPVADGCGIIEFDYAQIYSGGSTMKIYVNSTQYGGDIIVSSTSSSHFSTIVDVSGDISIEIVNSGNRTLISNLEWSCYGSSNDSDSEVYDSGSQPAVSDIVSTSIAFTDVFEIEIEDQGTADGLVTDVTNVRIKPHASNTADWTDHISDVKLNNGSDIAIGSPTITDTYIDIPITSGNLEITDGTSDIITLQVQINNTGITDGAVLSFMVDADAHGFTADASGSDFTSAFTLGDFNSNDFTIAVTATELRFVQQPANAEAGVAMSSDPTVEATDVNGNRDIDFNTAITIGSSGTITGGTSGSWTSGLATFSNVTHSEVGTGFELTTSCSGVTDATSSTFNITVNSTSDIVLEAISEPENIDYSSYQTTDITGGADDIEVAQFTIRDGGGSSDADGLSTTLTDIAFTLSNWENIRRVAIYDDGDIEIDEVDGASTVTFSGISLSAADNGSVTFSIRVSFNATVTDNDQFQFVVTSATADAAGSGFSAADAGAATSSTTGDENRIEVTATELQFAEQPSNSMQNITMSPKPTVKACDANGNVDVDYATAITITSSGTLSSSPVTGVLADGVATFTIKHTATGTGLTLTAASSGLSDEASSTFDITELINCSDLMISEYMEGSGLDKAIELFNGTGSTIVLGNYQLGQNNNPTEGDTDYELTLELTGYSIPHGEIFLIINSGASQEMRDAIGAENIDLSTANTMMDFNGNDPVGLFKDVAKGWQLIDAIDGAGFDQVNLKRNADVFAPSATFDINEWSEAANTYDDLGGTDNPLPVTWRDVSAQSLERGVFVKWSTRSEINNDYFEVEHSLDNQQYNVVGRLEGAGISTVEQNYSFMHRSAAYGINYYRIKQVDFDGTTDFSRVVAADYGNELFKQLSIEYIYTASTQQEAVIMYRPDQFIQIEIFDITGNCVHQNRISGETHYITYDFSHVTFQPGIYIFSVRTPQGTAIKKFVVQ